MTDKESDTFQPQGFKQKLISVDDLSNQRNQVFKDYEEFIESSVKETIEKWNDQLHKAFIEKNHRTVEINYFGSDKVPAIVISQTIERIKEQLKAAKYSFIELSEGTFKVQNPFISTKDETILNEKKFQPSGYFGGIPNYGGNGIFPVVSG